MTATERASARRIRALLVREAALLRANDPERESVPRVLDELVGVVDHQILAPAGVLYPTLVSEVR